jgi:hypothetical protein
MFRKRNDNNGLTTLTVTHCFRYCSLYVSPINTRKTDQKISQRAAVVIVLIIVVNTDPCTSVTNALLQDRPSEFVHKFALL